MTKAINDTRPLSPHLGIYKWQLTMFLSILHRASGVVLFLGTLLIAWGIAAGVYIAIYSSVQLNPQVFDFSQGWIGKVIDVILLGWTFSLFYHLCNGLRHLFWDIGYGFEVATAKKTAVLAVLAAFVLTGLSWYFALVK